MARINVDDDVESHPEYRKLHTLVGDDDRALGMLVRFWRVAQKFWGRHELVPASEINRWGFEPLVQAGWAVETPEGYKARGAEEKFGWYRDKKAQSSEGGKRSAEVRRSKYGTAQPLPKQTRTDVERQFEPPNPLSLSPALSLSQKEEEEEQKKRIPELAAVECDDFLDDVPLLAQKAWVSAYGAELVKTQLPLCWAAWASNTSRQIGGAKAVFIRNWLQNEKNKPPNTTPVVPQKTYTTSVVSEAEAIRTRLHLEEMEKIPPPTEEAKARVHEMVAQICGRDRAAGKDE